MPDYTITELDISKQGLTQLPDDIAKYTKLKKLICVSNQLTSLDYLPITLKELYCGDNKLTSLDNLPPNLEILHCYSNPLIYTFVPTLENIRNYNNSKTQSS